jgi:hypothetical protein
MARSTTEQHFIDNEISKALDKVGLPVNCAQRSVLERDAVVLATERDCYVRLHGEDGRELSLAQRLDEMRSEPAWRGHFPAAPKAILAKNDLTKMRENFDDIALGKVVVR